jgi:hypothetical protein
MSADAEPAPEPAAILSRVARLAALAIALGFLVQALVLAAKLAAGATVPLAALALDVASGIAWSVVVCLGTGLGVAVMRAGPATAAAIAALFAPLAVAASKAANQMMATAIGAVGKPAALSIVALAGLKAFEYGLLGYLLARLARGGETRLGPYGLTGLGVGLVFAGIALAIRLTAGAAPLAEIAALAVNEAVFPAGCAAVVYVGVLAARAAPPQA